MAHDNETLEELVHISWKDYVAYTCLLIIVSIIILYLWKAFVIFTVWLPWPWDIWLKG